jgi:phosphopantetheinyl transferase
MHAISTRYARLSELLADDTAAASWLSEDERAVQARMQSTERRATWLAGRILTKRVIIEAARAAGTLLAERRADELHIESRSTNPGHGERPTLFVDGCGQRCAISIAHSQRGVLAAVSLDANLSLGVDLVEPTDAHQALRWTFTRREGAWLAAGPHENHRPEQLWAMKEALYKACQRGEGFSPQGIEVVPGESPSYPNLDLTLDLRELQCWRVDGQLAALATVQAQRTIATTMDVPRTLTRAA